LSHPSGYYLARFDETSIVITPQREAGHFDAFSSELRPVDPTAENAVYLPLQYAEAWCDIETDDLPLTIQFEVVNATVEPTLIQKAKRVLSQIVEMDAAARACSADHKLDEDLNYIRLSETEVEIRYVAGTCNTEWGAYFVEGPDGIFRFEYLG
jgi:hypothetical protein